MVNIFHTSLYTLTYATDEHTQKELHHIRWFYVSGFPPPNSLYFQKKDKIHFASIFLGHHLSNFISYVVFFFYNFWISVLESYP